LYHGQFSVDCKSYGCCITLTDEPVFCSHDFIWHWIILNISIKYYILCTDSLAGVISGLSPGTEKAGEDL
jgi:hypothetical protein